AGGLAGSSANSSPTQFGTPVTTLAAGYPTAGYPPAWPNFNPGQFPTGAPTPGPFGGAYMDLNAGRPARQYQWSIGFQREIGRNMVAEATYVANRGVWWQAPGLLNLNALSLDRLKAVGLDLNSAADRTILTSLIGSAGAGRFQNRLPYPG